MRKKMHNDSGRFRRVMKRACKAAVYSQPKKSAVYFARPYWFYLARSFSLNSMVKCAARKTFG